MLNREPADLNTSRSKYLPVNFAGSAHFPDGLCLW